MTIIDDIEDKLGLYIKQHGTFPAEMEISQTDYDLMAKDDYERINKGKRPALYRMGDGSIVYGQGTYPITIKVV